eukprot:15036517-Alexandrium_andersonii.AAC.1
MWNLDQTIQKVGVLAEGTLCRISHGIAKRKVETITEILEAMAKGLQHDEEQWSDSAFLGKANSLVHFVHLGFLLLLRRCVGL